jgi:hypothetical protein
MSVRSTQKRRKLLLQSIEKNEQGAKIGGASRELKKGKRKAKLAALWHMHTYPVGSTMEIIRGIREGCCVLSKDGWTAEKKELGRGRNPKESPHLKPSFPFKPHELLP